MLLWSHSSSKQNDIASTKLRIENQHKHNSRHSQASFQGDLKVITIENLMQLVSHATLSGELRLTTSDNSAILFVQKGTLVSAYLEENFLRIGRRLVENKAITNEQLQECLLLALSQSPKPRIGKILIEKGYLQQRDLEKAITEQSRAIFFEVLSWKEGSFAFSIKNIPNTNDISLEERIDHLIITGIVHLDNLS